MVEGCQNMYTEIKTIETGLNALNQSTVTLAHKHIDVTDSLNSTIQNVLAIQQVLGDLQTHITQVEGKATTLKRHAARTLQAFAKFFTAIENACALTAQSLTLPSNAECLTIRSRGSKTS